MDEMHEFPSRKSRNASFGHVKKRLLKDEPLTGKTLAAALYAIEITNKGQTEDDVVAAIREKLITGTSLSEYECSLMIDSILVHAKLV